MNTKHLLTRIVALEAMLAELKAEVVAADRKPRKRAAKKAAPKKRAAKKAPAKKKQSIIPRPKARANGADHHA